MRSSLRTSLLFAFALTGCELGPGELDDGFDVDGHPIAAQESALTGPVCPPGPYLEGIDISHYQVNPNFTAVAGAGKRFVITKATQGTSVDPTFAANWAAIKAAGMIRGAYHWFNPATDPVAQADAVIRTVGKLGPGDLPVMADVEEMNGTIPSASLYASRLKTWSDRVEAGTGKKVMIYTGGPYWAAYLGDSALFADHPLAVAHYTTATCTAIPTPWKTWTLWQYRGDAVSGVPAGTCAGISGSTDLDHFNGTQADLNALAGIVPPPPPPPPPVDAGQPKPMDAGSPTPPVDAGSPPVVDAGSPPVVDAWIVPTEDAGVELDAGVVLEDAGNTELPAEPDAGAVTPPQPHGPGHLAVVPTLVNADPIEGGGCGCGSAPMSGVLGLLGLAASLRRRKRGGRWT